MTDNTRRQESGDPIIFSVAISRSTVPILLFLIAVLVIGIGLMWQSLRLGHHPVRQTFLFVVGGLLLVASIYLGSKTQPRLSKKIATSWLQLYGSTTAISIFSIVIVEFALRLYFLIAEFNIEIYQPSFIYAAQDQSQFDRRRFVSHPFLPYVARPFDSRILYIYRPDIGKQVTYDYSLNSLGLRSPEYTKTKPVMTKRIVTLGGSTTWDGPTNDQTWPAMLEKKLNEYYAKTGYKIQVINMATDGYNSPQSLVILALLGVGFEPDLIISYDGVNDSFIVGYENVQPDYRNIMSKFDENFETLQSRLPSWVFGSYVVSVLTHSYDQSIGRAADINGQVLVKTRTLDRSSDPIAGIEYFERNLKLMRGISREYNAKFVASTAHWVTPSLAQASQNAHLRTFFDKEQINFLDLDALIPHDDWTIHVDQVHWTVKGLDYISDLWLQKIVKENQLGL